MCRVQATGACINNVDPAIKTNHLAKLFHFEVLRFLQKHFFLFLNDVKFIQHSVIL
jgi:hypothetical protein